jgi:hypothetical protein
VFGTWSAAVTGEADMSSASVDVTVGGQPRAVSNLSDLGEGFGTGQTLSWNVALDEADRHADVPIVVTITGATPQPLSYTVNAFRSRIRAELAAKAKRTKRRLKVRATITPQANGDKLTLTTRGKTYTRTIRKGAARFNVPRGKAKLRYAGSDTVLPATLTLRR